MGSIHVITYRCYYINGPHKQYILLDIIFNYNFHFGLPGKYLYNTPEIRLTYQGLAPGKFARFLSNYTDIFLEVQNENCS